MEFTAKEIAGFLNGTVEGDAEIKISNVSKIDEGSVGTMTFLANPKYIPYVYTTEASVIVVNNDFVLTQPFHGTLIRVADAYAGFVTLLEMFGKEQQAYSGISPHCTIHPTAVTGKEVSAGEYSYIGRNCVIGDRVIIHPQVYIGDHVEIGEGSVLHPGVKIYKDCIIGRHCTLHAGVVIGSDGFGFAPVTGDLYRKIPQLGNVILEDHVEIGSNTTVDRATLGSTILRKGVKLDNLIQVAHNVEIGENTVIAAQTGISGSTKIGRNCMIGGQVGIVGHITIADEVKIGAQSGIDASVTKPGAIILGTPAIDASKTRRNYIHMRNLDDIAKKVYSMDKKVNK